MWPYRTDREPALLFPAMPPSVARLAVATSIGKKSPCGRRNAFSRSSTIPGSTTMRRAAGSKSSTPSSPRLVSRITPRPIDWPLCDVPAPRTTTEVPCSPASSTARRTSPADSGNTTPSGSTW